MVTEKKKTRRSSRHKMSSFWHRRPMNPATPQLSTSAFVCAAKNTSNARFIVGQKRGIYRVSSAVYRIPTWLRCSDFKSSGSVQTWDVPLFFFVLFLSECWIANVHPTFTISWFQQFSSTRPWQSRFTQVAQRFKFPANVNGPFVVQLISGRQILLSLSLV